jgi:hypothetical protein
MGEGVHTTGGPFPPPLDTLTGRWRVERAERGGEPIRIQGRPARVWALTVRHVESDTVTHVRAKALAATVFRVGQEMQGHIGRDFDGEWFRRDRPARRR